MATLVKVGPHDESLSTSVDMVSVLSLRDINKKVNVEGAVIEELEANVEEINNKDAAQQNKIKKLEVLTDKVIRFSVAVC